MSEETRSYRQILRSTSIVGGATVGGILIGLVRLKLFALLIGPAGLGMFGLLNNVAGTGAAIGGAGISSSGVRELSHWSEDPERSGSARKAFWLLTILLSLVSGVVLWALRAPLSAIVADRTIDGATMGWIGLAVALAILSASRLAELQAYRRMGDLARVQLLANLFATAVGVGAVATFGIAGVVPALIAVPLFGVLVGVFARPPLRPLFDGASPGRQRLLGDWKSLLSLGFALMASGIIGMLTQLAIRAMVVNRIGLDASGLFQAAWGISVTNLGVVLAAMAADYFPRVSRLASDREGLRRLTDQQLHVALLIGGPLLIGLTAVAHPVLLILYSHRFAGAQAMLQWQLAGDLFKIVGWVFGYVLIARRDTKWFLGIESSFAIVYVSFFVILEPFSGLDAAGQGYCAAYAIYAVGVVLICSRRHGASISGRNLSRIAATAAAILLAIFAEMLSPRLGMAAGVAIALLFALTSVRELGRLADHRPAILDRLFGKGRG